MLFQTTEGRTWDAKGMNRCGGVVTRVIPPLSWKVYAESFHQSFSLRPAPGPSTVF